jgi:predicted O-methyltransferase YrrM
MVSKESIGVKPISFPRKTRRFINPGEIEVLIALLRSIDPIESMIEIGVNEGYTARAILDNIDSIHYYLGIDVMHASIHKPSRGRAEIPRNPGHAAKDFAAFGLRLYSRGSLDLDDLHFERASIDAMFIDGDHGRAAVQHDTDLAINWVRPGGIIIWHDYVSGRGVDVQEILEAYHKDWNIRYVENTWLAFMIRP